MPQSDRIGIERDYSVHWWQLCDSQQNMRDWTSSKAGLPAWREAARCFLPLLKNPFFQPCLSPGLSTKNQPHRDKSVVSRFTHSLPAAPGLRRHPQGSCLVRRAPLRPRAGALGVQASLTVAGGLRCSEAAGISPWPGTEHGPPPDVGDSQPLNH